MWCPKLLIVHIAVVPSSLLRDLVLLSFVAGIPHLHRAILHSKKGFMGHANEQAMLHNARDSVQILKTQRFRVNL